MYNCRYKMGRGDGELWPQLDDAELLVCTGDHTCHLTSPSIGSHMFVLESGFVKNAAGWGWKGYREHAV